MIPQLSQRTNLATTVSTRANVSANQRASALNELEILASQTLTSAADADADRKLATDQTGLLGDSDSVRDRAGNKTQDDPKELFREFVGETLFGQLLASMHSTHDKPAYFHGGQAEEIFQQQLDQQMVQEITESSADKIADPMYELFQMQRR